MTGSELISIVIPVYNEAGIIEERVATLLTTLKTSKLGPYEILLCENGSNDNTLRIAQQISNNIPNVKALSVPGPDYGRALKEGLKKAGGKYLVVFGIDRFDINFLKQGLELIRKGADIVIGSKLTKGGRDTRSVKRRIISRAFSLLTKILFNYKGTDVHGLKIIKRNSILPVLNQCKMDDVMFDTELLVRAQRKGLKIRELPVIVREIRPSSYSLKKGKRVMKDIIILFYRMMIEDEKDS